MYLNVDDVADILKLNKRTVYKMFHQNDFPKVQIGRQYLVSEDDFNKYMKHYTYKKIEI